MISFDLTNFPKTVVIGRRVCAADWEYTNYVIQNYELIFIYHGEAYITIDGTTHTLKSGEFMLLLPGQVFSSRTTPENPCRYYILHFMLDTPVEILSDEMAFTQINDALKSVNFMEITDIFQMPPINFKRIYISNKIALGAARERIFNILENAVTERNQLNLSSEIMISCYLCEILIILSRLSIENLKIDYVFSNANGLPRTIQEAVFFIHDNYAKQISLKDICRYLAVSPQYLNRTFRKSLNRSTLEYINLFRISRAKDMLRYTSLSVKEITYEIGLQNPHYFCRLFKKIEGITPSEFREKGRYPI